MLANLGARARHLLMVLPLLAILATSLAFPCIVGQFRLSMGTPALSFNTVHISGGVADQPDMPGPPK